MSQKSAIGLFDAREDANRAAAALLDAGFTGTQVHVMGAHEVDDEHMWLSGPRTDSHRIATAAGAGALSAGIAGLLIGIGVASAATGMMQVVWPLVTIFGCAGGGAAVGAAVGTLAGAGVAEEHAEYYLEGVHHGGTVVVVVVEHTADARRAADLLTAYGAVNMEERVEAWKRQVHGDVIGPGVVTTAPVVVR